MLYETITSSTGLAELCRHIAAAQRVGFDTEFVSEDTFYPELCLIQVIADDVTAVIDPYEVRDLTPFWQALADGNQTTIIHAAREELNFSFRAIERSPANVFDTQIAAGFCSHEYPSSYGSVVTKFLGHRPEKGEQRTDWRRRPLTDSQIEYALEDVRYLLPLHTELTRRLRQVNRERWFAAEMADWMQGIDQARSQQRWRRVSGIGNLSVRSLAIVRELWLWRQEEARRRDLPPRRVLRDDLIVEIAKRKSDNPDKIRAVRGMQRGAKRKLIDDIAACVRRGLQADLSDMPQGSRQAMPSQLNLLGQFLSPALSSICRQANVATSLVGTASDVRDLIAYRLNFAGAKKQEPPYLATGWRAELVGNLIDDLLAGRKSIRIEDPRSEHPLEFDEVTPDCDAAKQC